MQKEINFLKNRNIYLSIFGILFFLSFVILISTKLHFGIDMTGGIQSEYSYKIASLDIEKVRVNLEEQSATILHKDKKAINEMSVYKIANENKIAVIAGFDDSIETKELETLKATFRADILATLQKQDKDIAETNYTNIGKSFGDYIKNTAIITLGIALIAIGVYVAYAFSGVVTGMSMFSFAFITIFTLFHDVIVASGAYVFTSIFFPQFKIDTFFVTALLTILGYSINDTIVVFDRIRSNLALFLSKKGKETKGLAEIINLSIQETMKRSIYTSSTVLFVLIAIFLFGPAAIKGFILLMIFGTIFGTYSSIFIASPLLYIFNKNKKITLYKKVEKTVDDKIIV